MVLSCAVAAMIAFAPLDRAAEPDEVPPAPPSDAPPAPPAPAEPPKPETVEPAQKDFWEDQFALYVEFGIGQADAEEITTPIETAPYAFTESFLSLEGQDFGRAAVGWTLSNGRGTFLVAFEGYKESGYTFDSVGYETYLGGGDVGTLTDTLPWWQLSIEDGVLNSSRTPPRWNLSDDANGDGLAQREEVRFPVTDAVIQTGVPEDLVTRISTIDGLYQRDFGGRRISGRWDVGLRYFSFQGNLPATAWLTPITPGQGFTDGLESRLLVFHQDTTALGPTFSLEVQFHFFRKRLQLYAKSRGAFLSQTLDSDSGDFYTLARDDSDGSWYPSPARLQREVDKSVWNFGAEAGLRFRILEGFWLNLGYSHMAYQDSILLPVEISVPPNLDTVHQSTVAVYRTQDLTLKTFRGGLSFQF
jgi:hypothetical protein